MNRLAPIAGEWIDRRRPVAFKFEGRRYSGFEGDTISSALLANGVKVLGRSFKYHRPRGVLSFANHDANALVQWGARPNLRADVTAVVEGMELSAVNTFGGLAGDRGRFIEWLAPVLPVGFYYKAFYSQRWEPMFRRIAGLGRVQNAARPLRTAKRYGFCDVLVIGAGASGRSAAQAAADAGASVVLVDENAHIDMKPHPRMVVRPGTVATGYYADHWVPLIDEQRMTKMRARAVVVCSGVFEQPAVFRNNDLPGVMLASAAQRLIQRYAVKPFNRVVVLTANSDGERAAEDFARHGIDVAAIVDLRAGEFIHAANGRNALASVEVGKRTIQCDGVAMSVGYAPAASLLYQAGAKMRYAKEIEQFVPEVLPEGIFVAGRVRGVYDPEHKSRDGENAGRDAARYLGFHAASGSQVPIETVSPNHPYPVFAHSGGKNFIDFDEDVVLADLHNAAQEGFDSIELMKRFTTVGMGPSQGKHSNMNAVRVLARIRGEPVEAVGTTTARPFFHPVPMAILAGRSFHAARRTPLHSRHEALGAKFIAAGQWWRPAHYGSIDEEALAVRRSVGLIDVGTLGKLEIRGADTAEFLERVYTGRFANLRPGMTRYGLMLDEAGVVMDDGVIARLGEDRFYFTTTTSGSAGIYRELARLNTMWQLDCGIVNLTGHMGAVNLAGPNSQRLLARLTKSDLSDPAFPYLAVRELTIAGIAVRAMRVGFVAQMAYELHAPADSMGALWDALMDAGGELGIRPFGVEAQRLLRLEKGHIIVGQDTDGLTTPFEAGCGWAVKMDKPFFIGQRSLRIIQKQPLRQRLVGFELEGGDSAPKVLECHLAIDEGNIAGRVTSVAWSPTLSKHIGLAMLRPDIAERGHFHIRTTEGTLVKATVVATPFSVA